MEIRELAISGAWVFTPVQHGDARGVFLEAFKAPMLSQLLSGHRTKLGNPAAVTRLAALNDLVGQVFSMFVLTVAAGEAAIGLAILVIYFRGRGTIAVDDANRMKG